MHRPSYAAYARMSSLSLFLSLLYFLSRCRLYYYDSLRPRMRTVHSVKLNIVGPARLPETHPISIRALFDLFHRNAQARYFTIPFYLLQSTSHLIYLAIVSLYIYISMPP